jgi:hypothetical protein
MLALQFATATANLSQNAFLFLATHGRFLQVVELLPLNSSYCLSNSIINGRRGRLDTYYIAIFNLTYQVKI